MELYNALDPQEERSLHWDREAGKPVPSAVPAESPDLQPLFGMNRNLKPLYVQRGNDDFQCLRGVNDTEYCLQSTRGLPAEGWSPAFVAWPLKTAHVQTLVTFARKHKLCVSVASTGHDFLNRHSCDQGLMIRTAMMKGLTWDLTDTSGLGHASVRMGAGLTFAEVMESGSLQSPTSYIASGWAQSVGVVGWHLGGGHGPNGKSLGMGVDNLLEVELVLSDGRAVTASKTQHADLFWALRGGGGSTWGVVTAVTARAHSTPAAGFTVVQAVGSWSLCGDFSQLASFFEAWVKWTSSLDERWNGLNFFLPGKDQSACGKRVTLLLDYNYHGAASDAEFKKRMQEVGSLPIPLHLNITSYRHWWNFVQGKDIHEDLILPVNPFVNGLMSSVAVSQETATASLPGFLTASLQCFTSGSGASTHMFYHLAGANASMAAASSEVSVHSDFHQAMFHYITSAPAPQNLYTLGESSYFSESAYKYGGDAWKTRYWGQNYAKLERVKLRYDEANLFWCHNCVGSDLPRPQVSLDAVMV